MYELTLRELNSSSRREMTPETMRKSKPSIKNTHISHVSTEQCAVFIFKTNPHRLQSAKRSMHRHNVLLYE